MISDGYVNVECDRCHYEEQMVMTALARGGYDTRHIESRMKRDGWQIDGGAHTCPDCVDEIAGSGEGQHDD